jgi:hypothetical protein
MRHRAGRHLLLATLLFIANLSYAQSGNQGSLEGTVADPSGAVIPAAHLKVTSHATGVVSETVSGPEGLYKFPVLPVGAYDLTVDSKGFANATFKNIEVAVGAKVNLPVSLRVSGDSVVDVTSEAPIVETTRTHVASTVDSTSVRDLPVNGRNFIDFVLLTPAVTKDVRTGDISFGGQRGTLNSLTVDGADDNNTFFGQTTGRTGSGRAPYQFSQDAVQEFQVNSNGYSAELGHAGGAVINVVTKSGTNKFHGTGFEFYRDRGLAANDPINKMNNAILGVSPPIKPAYHFHQFGGNIGGPIVKDKAFFFFDYDGQRNTQLNTVILNIPNIAAPTAFQTAAINYLSARAGNWTRGLNQDTYLAKGDWNVNQRNQIQVRYNRQNFVGQGFENGGSTNSFEHTGASSVTTDTLAASLTSTLSPHWVNVARFNYQRDLEPGAASSNNPEAVVRELGQTLLTVGRNSFSPRATNIHRQEYADTITWVHNQHTFKAGLDIIHDDIFNFFPGNFSGNYTFNSLENFGRSLAGAPLINVAPGAAGDNVIESFAGTGTTGPTTQPNINEYSWFLQDDWRALKSLTLNFGLRYDLQASAKPTVQNPAAAAAGIFTDQLNTDANNFGPRFGFAWTPWTNGTVVVRGGYGMFYGRTPSIMVGTAHSNNGINVVTRTFTAATVPAIPAYPNNLCGAPSDTPNCAAPVGGTSGPPVIFVFQPDYQQPAIQQANFGVEVQVAKDTSVAVGYQFVKGNHLQRTRDINLAPPTVATIPIVGGPVVSYNLYSSTRPIAAFNRILQFEGSANSEYNGFTAQVVKRFSHNFQGTGAYTWSHVIDDAPDATAVVPVTDDAKEIYDPLNPRADRGSGVNDQRHRFVASGIWDLNYANKLPKAAQYVAGGWQISTIFTLQSGQPYSGLVNFDLNNDGNSRSERTPGIGRDTFYSPVTYRLDPRFTKTFSIWESVKLQTFVEAFNIFNHFNKFNIRNTQFSRSTSAAVCGVGVPQCLVPQSAGATAFGLPTSTSVVDLDGARIFQLGAKITF